MAVDTFVRCGDGHERALIVRRSCACQRNSKRWCVCLRALPRHYSSVCGKMERACTVTLTMSWALRYVPSKQSRSSTCKGSQSADMRCDVCSHAGIWRSCSRRGNLPWQASNALHSLHFDRHTIARRTTYGGRHSLSTFHVIERCMVAACG
jgi:hypothetical protein